MVLTNGPEYQESQKTKLAQAREKNDHRLKAFQLARGEVELALRRSLESSSPYRLQQLGNNTTSVDKTEEEKRKKKKIAHKQGHKKKVIAAIINTSRQCVTAQALFI